MSPSVLLLDKFAERDRAAAAALQNVQEAEARVAREASMLAQQQTTLSIELVRIEAEYGHRLASLQAWYRNETALARGRASSLVEARYK